MKADAVIQQRCTWCGDDPLYVKYHDEEWGRPCHDERTLFEFLTLEGAQAGLSWITILRKRENYRVAFDNFNVEKIVRYTDSDVERLMNNPGIVRNRLKINSVITNAHAYLKLREEFGGLDAYLWRYVDGLALQPRHHTLRDVPAKNAVSDALSKDLSKRGFKFVGSTICYAYMQAIGLTNDHLVNCPVHGKYAGK